MSVLVQRPHQVPGVITLPRPIGTRRSQQQTSATSIPAIQQTISLTLSNKQPPSRRQQHRHSPSKSQPKTPKKDELPFPESVSSPTLSLPATTPQPPQTPPRKQRTPRTPQPKSSPAPNPAPKTTPVNVPANRRRAKSPRPTQRLPPSLQVVDSPSPSADQHFNSNRFNSNQGPTTPDRTVISPPSSTTPPLPTTWQQASFQFDQSSPIAIPPFNRLTISPVPNTSFVTLDSPLPQIPHSPTMPNLHSRPTRTHVRAPSYPTIPTASFINNTNASSLPQGNSLHAHMQKRERTLTGGTKFASASFQRAPDAISLPKPNFMFGKSDSSTSSDEEDDDILLI